MLWPLRYALVFLAVAIGVGFAAGAMGGEGTGTGLMSTLHLMVPVMVAALVEGMQTAKRLRDLPARWAALRFAAVATVLAVALGVVLAYGAGRAAPAFAQLIATEGERGIGTMLVIYLGGCFLANRFLYSLGAANHLNTMKSRGEIE